MFRALGVCVNWVSKRDFWIILEPDVIDTHAINRSPQFCRELVLGFLVQERKQGMIGAGLLCAE